MMTRSMRPKLGFALALVLSLQSLAEAAELTAHWPVGPGGGMVDAVAGIHQLLPGKLAQMVVRETCGSATVTYAQLPGSAGSSLTTPVIDFSAYEAISISFWVRTTLQPSGDTVMIELSKNFNDQLAGADGGLFYLGLNSAGAMGAAIHHKTGDYSVVNGSTPVNDGAWHHVVVELMKATYPDNFKIYVDGANESLQTVDWGAAATQNAFAGNQRLYVGGRGGDGSCPCDMDDLRIYSGALSFDEVQQVFAGGERTVEESPLVAWWKFNGGGADASPGACCPLDCGSALQFGFADLAGFGKRGSLFFARFPGDTSSSFATTTQKLGLSEKSVVSLSFHFRKGRKVRDENEDILFELSEDFNSHAGSFIAELMPDHRFRIGVRTSTGWALKDTVQELDDGNFHHIAVVLRKAKYPANIEFIVDGQVDEGLEVEGCKCSTDSDFAFYDDKIFFGGRNGDGSVHFDLSDFRIYDVELTEDLCAAIADEAVVKAGGTVCLEPGYGAGDVRGCVILTNGADSAEGRLAYCLGRSVELPFRPEMMRVAWQQALRDHVVAAWPFATDTSDAVGSNDLEAGAAVTISGGYAALSGNSEPGLSTKSTVDLSSCAGYTVSCWVRNLWCADGQSAALAEFSPDCNDCEGASRLWYKTGCKFDVCLRTSLTISGYAERDTPEAVMAADGDWHHIAYTVTREAYPDNVRLYVDGTLAPMTDYPALSDRLAGFFANQKLFIGSRNGSSYFLGGDLDDVAIVGDGLNERQVQSICAGGRDDLAQVLGERSLVVSATCRVKGASVSFPLDATGSYAGLQPGDEVVLNLPPAQLLGPDGVQYRVASWRLYDKSDSGERMLVASGAQGNRIAFSVPEQAARLQLEVRLEKKSGFAVILR